jgi:hypothetical protein
MVTAPLAILAAVTALASGAPSQYTGDIPLPPPPGAASLREEYVFWAAVSVGQGRWTDTLAQDAAPGTTAGLALAWRLSPAHTFQLDLGLDRYRRTWVSGRFDPLTGLAERPNSAEQRWTAELGYGFDLLSLARPSRWSIELLLSAGLQAFDNPVVKQTLFPVGGGLRCANRFGEGSRLFAEVTGAALVGASDPGLDSIAGSPRSLLRARAGVSFSPAQALELQLAWRGELIAFARGSRQSDTVTFQAAFGL